MDNPTTVIHFIRHGAVHNPHNIFYGRLPGFGLSAEGRRQAGALAPFFQNREVHAVHSSPLLRARQTAAIIAAGLDLPTVHLSQRLLESHTPYDGRPLAELEARKWDLYSGARPPYEQPVDVFNRARRFIQTILKHHRGQSITAVSHADLIVFLALWANGHEVSYANKSLIEHKKIAIPFPANASVTTLTWRDREDLPAYEYHAV